MEPTVTVYTTNSLIGLNVQCAFTLGRSQREQHVDEPFVALGSCIAALPGRFELIGAFVGLDWVAPSCEHPAIFLFRERHECQPGWLTADNLDFQFLGIRWFTIYPLQIQVLERDL